MKKLVYYQTQGGKKPMQEWLGSIKDPKTLQRIDARLDRVALANFGDCKPVGEGVKELRLAFGSGYRVYFGEDGDTIVVLLCGGDKSSQTKDISQAKEYWKNYKEQ